MKQARLQAAIARWLHQQWLRRGWFAWTLTPFALLTGCYVWVKRRWYSQGFSQTYRAPVPVIIVGNLYVGGTGKTPVVIALVKQLKALGWHPGLISRGYGIKIGPRPRVGQDPIDPAFFGDEPALLAKKTCAPIAVHPLRRLACEALLAAHPEVDLIVSDDGLQHLALARDVEIVVQDARAVGNGWLLPAGPLRESASRLRAVDLVVTRQTLAARTGGSHDQAGAQSTHRPELQFWLQIIQFHSLDRKINISGDEFISFALNKRITAISAISEPDRFFLSLKQLGLHCQSTVALPDHHPLGVNVFADQDADIILITEKDAVKCRLLRDPRIWVAATEAAMSDTQWVEKISAQLGGTAQK